MELKHYGTKRHSGRYPWGSGDDPQRSKNIYEMAKELKSQGVAEKEIAKGFGLSINQLRSTISSVSNAERAAKISQVVRMRDRGHSESAIAERMGTSVANVKYWLKDSTLDRTQITDSTVRALKDQLTTTPYLDVGVGTERWMGISRTKLKNALNDMVASGDYEVRNIQIPQLGTNKKTTIQVLTDNTKSYKDIYDNKADIGTMAKYSYDGGRSYLGLEPPKIINKKRVMVRYAEDGGAEKDGVIEIRRNVPDLFMGSASYSQVRVAVEGGKYLKGMAIYGDNMPKGVDIIFNTNKSRAKVPDPMDTLKAMKDDMDNPFGATVKQIKNSAGDLSALNIVASEGDWGKWSKTISSQMLSKQPIEIVKKQLDLAYELKRAEFNDINSLTNPTIKKNQLNSFADGADADAVTLKAAALPRQAYHVILPMTSIKEGEIYAPNYKNGEKVVLLRSPHGGIFEIPELTVNNKLPEGNRLIPQAMDAVGIHFKTAERLSGADFDGDSVLVIPNNKGSIITAPALKGLKDFDAKVSYPAYDGMQVMTKHATGKQMGDITNLITDMSIKGADFDEIARAVRHSMVVIDAEKHKLDYKQSAIDNNIAALKAKYQGSARSGASTLISKASSETRVAARAERVDIDPKTGKKIFYETGETYIDSKGNQVLKTQKSTKMYEVDDAHKLSSGTEVERVYADYANSMKALANEARLTMMNTKDISYDPSVTKQYKDEIVSIKAKLNTSLKHAPLERAAQLIAGEVVKSKKTANPQMDADGEKRLKGQALAEARSRVGSKQRVTLTASEWEAIQAGAVSKTTLNSLLNNMTDVEIKKWATPRDSATSQITGATLNRIKLMLNNGYNQADIADAVGVSTTVIKEVMEKGGNF